MLLLRKFVTYSVYQQNEINKMKHYLTLLVFLVLTMPLFAQKTVEVKNDADLVYVLWDNKKAPHSNEETKDESINARGHFEHTSQCVFYLYKADPSIATGQAVVVLPGGGYSKVCIEHEGFAMAKYFQSIGVTALVVKYRLPNYGH